MARAKKDTSINIEAGTVADIAAWQRFIENQDGFSFQSIKMIPNENETGFIVAHATGVDLNGVETEFTAQHRALIEGTTANVTALKTATG